MQAPGHSYSLMTLTTILYLTFAVQRLGIMERKNRSHANEK